MKFSPSLNTTESKALKFSIIANGILFFIFTYFIFFGKKYVQVDFSSNPLFWDGRALLLVSSFLTLLIFLGFKNTSTESKLRGQLSFVGSQTYRIILSVLSVLINLIILFMFISSNLT